jgi:hypothetical protein
MATTVTIVDETTSGERTNELLLRLLSDRTTLRELIRSRVYQEVTEYNALLPSRFRGLVQPEQTERTLKGERLAPPRKLDWERQFDRALKAFRGNGFLVLVDDRQVDDLDSEVTLRPESQVTFLRLVPLVGG